MVYRGPLAGPRSGHQGLQAGGHREPRAQAQVAARRVREPAQQGVFRGARHVEIRRRAAGLRGRAWIPDVAAGTAWTARCTTSRSATTRTSSRRASWTISPNLVTLSHEASLYDIDLHAMNVMVDRSKGTPKLFDFNQIPFTERPQNPVHRAGAQARVAGARIARPAQAGALQELRSRGTQAAQVLRAVQARSKT